MIEWSIGLTVTKAWTILSLGGSLWMVMSHLAISSWTLPKSQPPINYRADSIPRILRCSWSKEFLRASNYEPLNIIGDLFTTNDATKEATNDLDRQHWCFFHGTPLVISSDAQYLTCRARLFGFVWVWVNLQSLQSDIGLSRCTSLHCSDGNLVLQWLVSCSKWITTGANKLPDPYPHGLTIFWCVEVAHGSFTFQMYRQGSAEPYHPVTAMVLERHWSVDQWGVQWVSLGGV